MPDIENLTDEELEKARIEILKEQERRANRAQIPAQITELRQKYVAGGGDPDELQ